MMSRATFKVICSPVPWTFESKGDSLDTWNGFRGERDELFEFLTTAKVEGVVLLSADRHRTDIWKLPRQDIAGVKAYPLFEFSSSRLTNQHVHREMAKAEFSYNKKQSFGLVTFDTWPEDPTVRFRVVDIDGKLVYERVIERSELCYE